MKIHTLVRLWPVAMLLALAAGCDTPEGAVSAGPTGNMKTQGVYTTLAQTEHFLDMPASAYVPRDSFGPGESAAAVIVGYGEYNQEKPIRLELIESGTGRAMLSRDGYATYGKAAVYRLPIRLTGSYELRLSSEGMPLDHCDFTVTRTNGAAPPTPAAAGNYANDLGFYVDPSHVDSSFYDYVGQFAHIADSAVSKDAYSKHSDLFAQRFPGSVAIRFRLDFQGRLTDPEVLQNTLDDDCAEVFKKALLNRSPYPAWPDDVHQALGTDYRDITMTISYK